MKEIGKIVIASHNQGKISEIREMLAPFEIEVCSAEELNLPDVEETGTTFEENARLKAETLAKASGLPCLADDSGLCVNALSGRPGVYSARYVPDRDFNKGMDRLLTEIANSGSDDRGAHFSCVLALAYPEGACRVFGGRVEGQIAREKSGNGGLVMIRFLFPTVLTRLSAISARKKKLRFRIGAARLQNLLSI